MADLKNIKVLSTEKFENMDTTNDDELTFVDATTMLSNKMEKDYSNANYQPVNKTGDTMTGDLVLTNNEGNPAIDLRDIPIGTSWNAGLIRAYGDNDNVMGTLQFASQENGNNSIYLTVTNPSTGEEKVWWGIQVDTNNKVTFSHPQVITDYVNGTSGYRIWSNGYCEQWGQVSTTSGSGNYKIVTFIKTFKDMNYIPQISCSDMKSGYTDGGTPVGTGCEQAIARQSSSSMSVQWQDGYNTAQVAWWKVSGYLAEGQY